MSNEQYNSQNSKKNKVQFSSTEDINEEVSENQYYESEDDINLDEDRLVEDKSIRKIREKPLKIFGMLCIVVTIVTFFISGTRADNSSTAKEALESKVSKSILPGAVLSVKNEDLSPNDYTIENKSNEKDTKLWIWDYADEDGDYVQVLIDGSPVGDVFMVKHKPKEFTVPASGKVEVKGVKDGAGGITYAVRYELNGTSYFNEAPEGETNTYTITN